MFHPEEEVAVELALRAGALALHMAQSPVDVTEKADDAGPVTAADKALNQLIVDGLRAAFPEDAVLGEESDATGFSATRRTWWVDPIDGTKDFIAQRPEWSVMIGLAVDGVATLGVVYQPNSGQLFVGVVGRGAWQQSANGTRTPLRCDATDEPARATATRSRNHPDTRIASLLEQIGIQGDLPHSSVGMKLALIAQGRAHIYFNLAGRCHLWDTCAGEAILVAAGGRLRTLDGGTLDYTAPRGTLVSAPFVTTTDALWPAVHTALQAAGDLPPEVR